MEITINLELTEDEKAEVVNTLTIDELFHIIYSNTGNHNRGFDKKELVSRILEYYPSELIDSQKIQDLIDLEEEFINVHELEKLI